MRPKGRYSIGLSRRPQEQGEAVQSLIPWEEQFNPPDLALMPMALILTCAAHPTVTEKTNGGLQPQAAVFMLCGALFRFDHVAEALEDLAVEL
jgi:hypothetical protein